jgi:hypothetical protein
MRHGDVDAAARVVARYSIPLMQQTDPAQQVEQWTDVARAAVAGKLWAVAAAAYQEAARAAIIARNQLVFRDDIDEANEAAVALQEKSRECERMAGG